jgi:hypothetical protein
MDYVFLDQILEKMIVYYSLRNIFIYGINGEIITLSIKLVIGFLAIKKGKKEGG